MGNATSVVDKVGTTQSVLEFAELMQSAKKTESGSLIAIVGVLEGVLTVPLLEPQDCEKIDSAKKSIDRIFTGISMADQHFDHHWKYIKEIIVILDRDLRRALCSRNKVELAEHLSSLYLLLKEMVNTYR